MIDEVGKFHVLNCLKEIIRLVAPEPKFVSPKKSLREISAKIDKLSARIISDLA